MLFISIVINIALIIYLIKLSNKYRLANIITENSLNVVYKMSLELKEYYKYYGPLPK